MCCKEDGIIIQISEVRDVEDKVLVELVSDLHVLIANFWLRVRGKTASLIVVTNPIQDSSSIVTYMSS